jgi:hypothetical protein
VDKSEPGSLFPNHIVAVAAAHNITVGTSPGLFSPDAQVSLAQVVTMVVRAAKNVAPTALATPPVGYQGTLGNFDATHGANMLTAEYNGLLVGGTCRPGFDPYFCATRGEGAQVLHNLLEKLPEPTTTTTTTPGVPIITALKPTSGFPEGGNSVVITGTNFVATT